jgi:hypothetical protein
VAQQRRTSASAIRPHEGMSTSTRLAPPATVVPVIDTIERGSEYCGLVALMSMVVVACGGRMDEVTTPERVTREDLIPRLQNAICDSAEACCRRAGLVRSADCRQRVTEYWQPIVAHAISIGANFDAAQAERCVNQIQFEWHQCADEKTFSSSFDDLCAKVFLAPPPLQKPGQSCEAPMDCHDAAGPTVLCIKVSEGAKLAGTCKWHLSSDANGPCGGTSSDTFAECNVPYVCGDDLSCRLRFELGEPCNPLGGDSCSIGNVCDHGASNLCRRATPIGEACTGPNDCENFRCIASVCRASPALPYASYCTNL